MKITYNRVAKINLNRLLTSCVPRITGGYTIEEDGKLVSYSTNDELGVVLIKHWKNDNGWYTVVFNPNDKD